MTQSRVYLQCVWRIRRQGPISHLKEGKMDGGEVRAGSRSFASCQKASVMLRVCQRRSTRLIGGREREKKRER